MQLLVKLVENSHQLLDQGHQSWNALVFVAEGVVALFLLLLQFLAVDPLERDSLYAVIDHVGVRVPNLAKEKVLERVEEGEHAAVAVDLGRGAAANIKKLGQYIPNHIKVQLPQKVRRFAFVFLLAALKWRRHHVAQLHEKIIIAEICGGAHVHGPTLILNRSCGFVEVVYVAKLAVEAVDVEGELVE